MLMADEDEWSGVARGDTSWPLIVLVLSLALVGLVLAVASLATQRSVGGMMGGMMGSGPAQDPGVGGVEWAVLSASAVLFVTAVLLTFRARSAMRPASAGFVAAPPMVARLAAPAPPSEPPLTEMTLVKLLDEDERRMYLEIRERGGAVLQRDLVSMGTFSKAKVTRVLDKLERRGLVVRERHGMTNRVRLVGRIAK